VIWQFDGMLGQWVRNHASISARPLGSRRLPSKLRTPYQKKNAVIPSATVNHDPVIERAFPDTLWPPPRTATSSSLYVFAPRRTLGQMRNSFGFPLLYSRSLTLHISTAIPVTDYFSKAKMRFQSFFMLMTIQPSFFASSLSASVKMPTFVSGRPWAGP
jgi:hypothetical protein